MGKISEAITAVFGAKSSEGTVTAAISTNSESISKEYEEKATVERSNVNSNQENAGQESKNCDSCRYIGSAVMVGCSVYLVTAMKRKPPPTYTLTQILSQKFAVGLLATCFAVTALFRFTETGPFDRKHDGIESMMKADIREEINDMLTKLGVVKQTAVDNKSTKS